MTAALEILQSLARARTMGVFIDQTMARIEQALGSSLTSFNRMDLDNRTATVAFRPYRVEHQSVVDGVSRLLDEHPLYRWYTSQPDWSPVRISDVTPWEQFRTSRLFLDVLAPVGGCHTIVVHVTPPPPVGEWIYFAVNRTDRDFTDAELALCAQLQPGLVALYTHLSLTDNPVGHTSVTLTRREQAVLGHLADGHTAEAIAHRMSTSPATIRKHLQNLYAKLGTSDRLSAVIRGRDLGLLRPDDLSRQFTWNVRADLRHTLASLPELGPSTPPSSDRPK